MNEINLNDIVVPVIGLERQMKVKSIDETAQEAVCIWIDDKGYQVESKFQLSILKRYEDPLRRLRENVPNDW
jgi:hypothetical protein